MQVFKFTRVREWTIYASALLAMLPVFGPMVHAQVPPQVSQFVGVSHPVRDEAGQILNGTDKFAGQYGNPAVVGDLVQILLATDGNIYPPGPDGSPDAKNTLILATRIGAGTSPALARSGKFSAALTPRPSGNAKIFVRVFNAASIEEATFYGDSQLFTVSPFANSVFMADIEAADKPLDSADPDGDGLITALEKAQGSDPYAFDTDGDRYSDAEEYIAGTDSLDENSFPMISAITPGGPGLSRITWSPNVSGRTYRVHFSESLVQSGIGTNTAALRVSTGNNDFIIITNADFSETSVFSITVSKESVND